jgi:hypothetical protein
MAAFYPTTPKELASFSTRFWANVLKTDDCWQWTGRKNRLGYGQISLLRPLRGTIGAHRVSYFLHYGPIPDGLLVCHTCDNPECTRPDHLWLGTVLDNTRDMIAKGRNHRHTTEQMDAMRQKSIRRGWANSKTKLDISQVLEIRRRYRNGEMFRRIAEDYPVGEKAVAMIARRINWSYVPEEDE